MTEGMPGSVDERSRLGHPGVDLLRRIMGDRVIERQNASEAVAGHRGPLPGGFHDAGILVGVSKSQGTSHGSNTFL